MEVRGECVKGMRKSHRHVTPLGLRSDLNSMSRSLGNARDLGGAVARRTLERHGACLCGLVVDTYGRVLARSSELEAVNPVAGTHVVVGFVGGVSVCTVWDVWVARTGTAEEVVARRGVHLSEAAA